MTSQANNGTGTKRSKNDDNNREQVQKAVKITADRGCSLQMLSEESRRSCVSNGVAYLGWRRAAGAAWARVGLVLLLSGLVNRKEVSRRFSRQAPRRGKEARNSLLYFHPSSENN